MSLLRSAWLNFAGRLWEQEVVEKLDAHERINEPGGAPISPTPNPHDQYMLEADAVAVFTFAAYGGLSLQTPGAGAGIGLAWETVQFDTVVPTTPRGITVDVTNNTLAFVSDGVYVVSLSINVTHDSSNQGREFQLRFWNVTQGAAQAAPITVTTGRNSDGSHMALTTLVEVLDANKGDAFRVEVGNTTDTYLTVEWDVAEFSAWNVGEWREPLPSDV